MLECEIAGRNPMVLFGIEKKTSDLDGFDWILGANV